jgi:hypothetical protein
MRIKLMNSRRVQPLPLLLAVYSHYEYALLSSDLEKLLQARNKKETNVAVPTENTNSATTTTTISSTSTTTTNTATSTTTSSSNDDKNNSIITASSLPSFSSYFAAWYIAWEEEERYHPSLTGVIVSHMFLLLTSFLSSILPHPCQIQREIIGFEQVIFSVDIIVSQPLVDGVYAPREEKIYQKYQEQEKAAQTHGKAGSKADGKAGEDSGGGAEDWGGEKYEASEGDKVHLAFTKHGTRSRIPCYHASLVLTERKVSSAHFTFRPYARRHSASFRRQLPYVPSSVCGHL